MRAKVLTLSFFSIFIVAMLAISVSAATIFSDDFDDGTLTGWAVTGWTPDTGGMYAESNSQVGAVLSRIVSTSGFQSIVVSYDRQLADNWEAENNFSFSWSVDGTIFTPLESVVGSGSNTLPNDTNFVPQTFNLPSSADNNANFEIRFECNTDASNELCNVDNVLIEGTATPTEILSCTAIGNPENNLNIKDIDFNNLGTLILKESSGNIYLEFGDDNEWFPLDYIEVEIEIENNGEEKIEDIEVEWGLYDTKKNEMVIDFDDEKDFDLKRNKDETLTISFQLEDDLDIDLDELGDDKDRYVFYVLATGFDNEFEVEVCTTKSKDVREIVIENDFVILTDVQYPETVQCGETVQISAKVWNIGDDDQDEVKVEVHNNDLGLFHKTTEIGDIDAFDDDVYIFDFKVPNDAEERTHSLSFQVLDEDFDVYENDFDDDDSEFTLPFRVSGGCLGVSGKTGVLISANIESGGKAGEDLVVRATVTNNDDESKVFTVNAAGFTQWASSYTADRTSLVLGAGDSVNVIFTFNVNKDASGSQSFTIELVSEDNEVTTQPVSVSIEGKRSAFSGLLTGAVTSGNAYLWGIAILNVILVLAIIIVAVRVLRK